MEHCRPFGSGLEALTFIACLSLYTVRADRVQERIEICPFC